MRAVGIVFSNIHDDEIPELVAKRTFASIPFGGRYRLIDFVLSNMVNSGIDTVGLITKKNYQSLMDHVGNGKDWDLARKNGGLILLPPFGNVGDNTGLYTSRMSALKGITNFINRADEEFVVMTDCDNVCTIDYSDVIKEHIKSGADVTLVYGKQCINKDTAKNSITLTVNGEGRVERIKLVPTLASGDNVFMNIYVMRKSLLQRFITESFTHNNNHFTTEVLASNTKSLYIKGYEYNGFFACIDSLQSYYESNLELLNAERRHRLFGDMPVYTKIKDSAPTRFAQSAIVKNSLIADGCVIEGEVENSILFRGVKVGRGSVIKNSILMQNTVTGDNVTLNAIIADKNVTIKDKRVLSGADTHPFYIGKGTMI